MPCGVTGGQIGAEKSRLDFDIGDMTLDKDDITKKINDMVSGNHDVSFFLV